MNDIAIHIKSCLASLIQDIEMVIMFTIIHPYQYLGKHNIADILSPPATIIA